MYARKKVKYYKEKAEEHRNGLREMLKKQKEYENMVAKEEISMGLRNTYVDGGMKVDARLDLEKPEEKKALVSKISITRTLPLEEKKKEEKKTLVSQICITKKVPSKAE